MMNFPKYLIAAGIIALSSCIGFKQELDTYKIGNTKNTLSLEESLDISATTHHLSPSATSFSPAPSTSLEGNVGNTSYPFSIALDFRNSTEFNKLNLNTGLRFHYACIDNTAHDMTGYMAGPWDVDYFSGIVPETSIEPYIGIEKKLNKHWSIDFSLGFPHTNFCWRKGYWEQINDSKTILEKEHSKKNGLSYGCGLELKIEDNFFFRLGIEQAYYKDINIAGEKTDIENTRLNAMLQWGIK